ncbi:excisionase family DNA binding protein, partial [Kitasatospora sp. GP30]|nr:excisionase family DNA binding protein [Kitasatospora sp. GP30]
MTARTPDAEPLLTPAEVATMFRVDPKTVTRWAKAGKLTSIRTLGGHRRYREAEVRALLAGIPAQRTEAWRSLAAGCSSRRRRVGAQLDRRGRPPGLRRVR